MPDFNEKAFFKRIAKSLHESGAMKTYDTPLGVSKNWGSFAKTAQVDAYRDIDPTPDDFEEYFHYFMQNLDKREHKQALQHACKKYTTSLAAMTSGWMMHNCARSCRRKAPP